MQPIKWKLKNNRAQILNYINYSKWLRQAVNFRFKVCMYLQSVCWADFPLNPNFIWNFQNVEKSCLGTVHMVQECVNIRHTTEKQPSDRRGTCEQTAAASAKLLYLQLGLTHIIVLTVQCSAFFWQLRVTCKTCETSVFFWSGTHPTSPKANYVCWSCRNFVSDNDTSRSDLILFDRWQFNIH